MLEALHKLGYRVTVLAPPDDYLPRLLALGVCNFAPLRWMTAKSVTPLKDALLTRELYRYYRQLKPDLVLHYTVKPNIWGSLAARWASVRSVNIVTGLGYTFLSSGLMRRFTSRLYRYALRESLQIVFHNDADAQLFDTLQLADNQRCSVIKGSGVNTEYFAAATDYSPPKVRRFLFIGRLIQDKGIGELIEAARQLRQWGVPFACIVAGDWGMVNPSVVSRQSFETAENEGLIRYIGHVVDVRAAIAEADIIVLPSYREGLSKSLLEGMSMSRPLITTDTPGCRETIAPAPNQNGLLVPIKDAAALANAMRTLAEMPTEQLLEMGQNSRKFVLEQFDERITLQRYIDIVTHVLPPPNL